MTSVSQISSKQALFPLNSHCSEIEEKESINDECTVFWCQVFTTLESPNSRRPLDQCIALHLNKITEALVLSWRQIYTCFVQPRISIDAHLRQKGEQCDAHKQRFWVAFNELLIGSCPLFLWRHVNESFRVWNFKLHVSLSIYILGQSPMYLR